MSGRGRPWRAESGQVTAWTVGLALLLFGIMALTVDVGFWFLERRESQNNADAAVLAAAQDLQDNLSTTTISTRANTYLSKNGHLAPSVCTLANSPDYDYVENGVAFRDDDSSPSTYEAIRVCTEAPGLVVFGNLLGLANVTIKAVAAVALQEAPTVYTIFANCAEFDDEPVLEFNAQNVTVTGHIHSNCGIKRNGSNNRLLDGQMTCLDNFDGSASNWTYLGGPPNCNVAYIPMPLPHPDTWYKYWNPATNSFRSSVCTRGITSGSKLEFNQTSIPAGVYCHNGDVEIKGSNRTHNGITIVATGQIIVPDNGSKFNLSTPPPGPDGIFLFSNWREKDKGITISGQSNEWRGTLYAPRGRVTANGSDTNSPIISSIIADSVQIPGQNFSLTGTVAAGGAREFEMIE